MTEENLLGCGIFRHIVVGEEGIILFKEGLIDTTERNLKELVKKAFPEVSGFVRGVSKVRVGSHCCMKHINCKFDEIVRTIKLNNNWESRPLVKIKQKGDSGFTFEPFDV